MTEKDVVALAKFVRISPTKVRRVVNMIKKMPYTDAREVLKLMPHKGAGILLKVINSAIFNAINNHKLNEEDIYIKNILIDSGFQFKRFQPRAKGRMFKIIKKTCHVKVIVSANTKEGVH